MAFWQSLWPFERKRIDLNEAVKAGDLLMVQRLVEEGADACQLDARGTSLLHVAAALGHLEIARLLVEKGANVNFVSRKSGTPVIVAATCLQPELLKLFVCHDADLNKRGIDGRFPLLCPYRSHLKEVDRQIRCIRLLVANGARINECTQDGNTALMNAAWFGNKEAVEELLRLGADPKLRNKSLKTASLRAAERGHQEVAEMLKQCVGA